MPGRLQGGQFVEHVIMAVPARLETVVDKLGVMTSEHVVSPGPEQAQGRCALLPCGQVWPPDGPLAPGPGRLPLSQLTCQRGEVTEAVFEFDDSAPLSLDVPAEGAQLPVKPLILVELALLVLAEVSQEPGQLAYLSFEPYEVAGTAAGGFVSFGRPPPISAISWALAATSPLQGGRSPSLMGWSSPAGVICGCVMGWS